MQFEKDKEAFDKRASSYRRLQAEPYHHSTQESILTLWEVGHIVDRGRGKAPEGSRSAPPKTERPLRQVTLFSVSDNKLLTTVIVTIFS